MEKIIKYIHERLHINKDTKPYVNLMEVNEYQGVNIISDPKVIEEWRRFSKVNIERAYNLLQVIIDNLHDDLKGMTLKLFYSGYSGFSIRDLNKNNNTIGFITFDNSINKYLNGIGCEFSEGTEANVYLDLVNKIQKFIRQKGKAFSIYT